MRYEYVYSSNQYVPKGRKKTSSVLKYIIFSCTIFFIGFFVTAGIHRAFFGGEKNLTIVSPLADSVSDSLRKVQGLINSPKLSEAIERELEGGTGTYSVVVKNLKTGESYYLHEHKKYTSASLYKLWTMAVVFQKVERNELDLEKEITYEIPDLNERFEIGTESAELTEGTFQMSIKNALHQMITISHNYAALSLSLEIGVFEMAKFLENYGFSESSTKSPPTTTPYDVALFYEKLYKGELAGPEYTAQMIELLKKQQLNDRIPKYLPEKVEVAHKTGELGRVKHDTGIVYAPSGDYILILMSDTANPQRAAERQAKISEAVYKHFQNK